MHFPRHLFALASCLVFAPVVHSQDDIVGLNGWYACSDSTLTGGTYLFDSHECAQFTVPLCHPGVCDDPENHTIEVFVKRLRAIDDPDNKPNVWFLPNGLGLASYYMEPLMGLTSMDMNDKINVYTFDYRGTGRSNLLSCVAAQAGAGGSPGRATIEPSEVPDCAMDLFRRYGGGENKLAAFSVTSAALDLKHFISTYQANSKVFIYGYDYASYMAERLIHLATPEIVGYVLDSVRTTSGSDEANFPYYSKWDVDFDEVARDFLGKCAEDVICNSHFTDQSLSTTLQQLFVNMDADPFTMCASTLTMWFSEPRLPSDVLRHTLGSLIQEMEGRALIPALVYRLDRCDDNDVEVLTHFFGTFYDSSKEVLGSEEDGYTSMLLKQLIIYSEIWETPTPSTATMQERWNSTLMSYNWTDQVNVAGYCAFTQEQSAACEDAYAFTTEHPIKYMKDQYWNVAAKIPSNVSVLLLSGKLDAWAPYKYAESLYDALESDNKALITFDNASSFILVSTPINSTDKMVPTCGRNLFHSYLENGGDLSQLDTSCVDQVLPLTFNVTADVAMSYMGTEDIYDGKYNGTLDY